MGKYDLFYKGRERWTGKCKEKVMNHRNNEFVEFLLKPIVDIEYYLPEFKEFDAKELLINGDAQKGVSINLNVPSLFKRIKRKVRHEDTKTEITTLVTVVKPICIHSIRIKFFLI